MKENAKIRFDGFYIATKQYMVVDSPVFDEIKEGIRVLQFYPNEGQKEGFVSIAELGELENHPQEVNLTELGKHFQSHLQDVAKEEKRAFWYTIQNSKVIPPWFNVLESHIFHKKKDPNAPSLKFRGNYVIIESNKFVVYRGMNIGALERDSEVYADGQISEESLSLVYHYEGIDWISVFKFVPFDD